MPAAFVLLRDMNVVRVIEMCVCVGGGDHQRLVVYLSEAHWV